MDYYGGGSYGYGGGGGGGGGFGYDDYYCNYGGTGGGYEDYGYEEYDFYSPMPYGMAASRGAGRMMYQVLYLCMMHAGVDANLQHIVVNTDRVPTHPGKS